MGIAGHDHAENAASFDPADDDVFGRIAGRYDRLCDLFSLRIHRLWKSHLAARIAERAQGRILDVATGTGDIPVRVLRRLGQNVDGVECLIASDICANMLSIAKGKLATTTAPLEFAILDAHDLQGIPSNSVDLYSIAFAMKICDRARVLAEAMRVLKPEGTFLCLEASRIPAGPVHRAYLIYMNWCMPLIGRLAAGGDRSAYSYLLRGIHDFPSQREFADELSQCGFADVNFENLTLGIVALHEGRKP